MGYTSTAKCKALTGSAVKGLIDCIVCFCFSVVGLVIIALCILTFVVDIINGGGGEVHCRQRGREGKSFANFMQTSFMDMPHLN